MSGVRLIQEIGTSLILQPIKSGCKPGLRVHCKARLGELEPLRHLSPHQLQIVREIPEASEQHQLRQKMEAAVGHDLLERIVQQHAVAGEAAAHDDVEPLGRSVEEIANFRQQVLEVAVHRQHPRPVAAR